MHSFQNFATEPFKISQLSLWTDRGIINYHRQKNLLATNTRCIEK